MIKHKRSGQVAEDVGIPYHSLHYLIRAGVIKAPEKDSAGFVWTPADEKRLAEALAERPPTLPAGQGGWLPGPLPRL